MHLRIYLVIYLFIMLWIEILAGELYFLDSHGNPREQPPRLQPTQRLRQVGGRGGFTSTPGGITLYTHLHEFSDLLCWMGTI